jgi:hypothetical protein
MNLIEYITEKSNLFIDRLGKEENLIPIDTNEWGWENYIYKSDTFRWAHIERYFEPHIMVLHITIFPHKNNTHPIFGFDLICYPKKEIIGAAFLDLSTTNSNTVDWIQPKFSQPYNLPEWASDIFSNKFIACIPTKDEYDILLEHAYELFDTTLTNLTKEEWRTNDTKLIEEIAVNQNLYCDRQSKNERTFGALKSKVGEERARYFMENILFPKI